VTSRKHTATLGCVVLVASLLLVAASPGAASPVEITREGWAWQAQTGPLPPTGPASGIGEDQLPVSVTPGGDDKISYVSLDEAAFGPEAGSEPGLVVRISIDPAGQNVSADQASVRACLVTEVWSPGAPMAWDSRPTTDCETAASGRFDAALNAFVFDLSPLAAVWSRGSNHGFSLQPGPGGPPLFQVVFRGSAAGGIETDLVPGIGQNAAVERPAADVREPDAPVSPSLGLGERPVPDLYMPGAPAVAPVARPVSSQPERSRRAAASGRVVTFEWVYLMLMVLAGAKIVPRVGVELMAAIAEDRRARALPDPRP
jgi:hypothetical protein